MILWKILFVFALPTTTRIYTPKGNNMIFPVVVGFAQAIDTVDICVIGAGPSGISAAYTAESLGYTVAIFEKEHDIGGKTRTRNDSFGFRYRMGAAYSTEKLPFSLQPLYDKFNIDLSYQPKRNVKWFDHQTQQRVEYTPSFNLFQLGVYVLIRTTLNRMLDHPNYMANATYPKSLNRLSAAQWMERRGISSLMSTFWIPYTAYGYGLFTKIPAVYLLKYQAINTDQTLVYFQDLLISMANTFKRAVYLNTTVENVQYKYLKGDGTIISFRHGMSSILQNIQCGSTVIAFPQLTKRMTIFTPPDTVGTTLKSITDQVKTGRYASALFDGSKQKEYPMGNNTVSGFFQTPNHEKYNNNNVLYIRYYTNRKSSVVAMSYAANFSISSEELLTNMFESYKVFINEPNLDMNATVKAFYDWDYFPHVNSASLQNGFLASFIVYKVKLINTVLVAYLTSKQHKIVLHMVNILLKNSSLLSKHT